VTSVARLTRISWFAHGGWAALAVIAVGALAATWAGERVLAVSVIASQPRRVVPVGELISILVAALVPPMVAPRLWSWESLARRVEVRRTAGAIAAVSIALPAMVADSEGRTRSCAAGRLLGCVESVY